VLPGLQWYSLYHTNFHSTI